MKRKTLPLSAIVLCLLILGQASADWPMPGHDAQRTSCSTETIGLCTQPVWCVQFDPYIPSRTCIVTKAAEGGVPATVYVTAEDGIHALYPDTGVQRWLYTMTMQPGDAPTVVGTTLYVSGMDKTIHAVNCANGNQIWQTDTAGAAFYANPLVVNGMVYAGCRDGYFYCFDATDGSLEWYYNIGVPISFSAAYQTYASYPQGLVFVGGANCKAYALRADTGAFVWERQLNGDTFVAWWPVVTQQRAMFGASTNYPTNDNDLRGLQRSMLVADVATLNDGYGNYQLLHHINWLNTYPQRNTFFVLDAVNGTPQEQSPFLFWANPGGQRYPASVASDNKIWLDTPWCAPLNPNPPHEPDWFGQGRYAGWDKATTVVKPTAPWESSDEPSAQALIGNYLYYNDGGDGVDKGGIFNLTTGSAAGSWNNATFRTAFGNYWGDWTLRKYGNNFRDGAGVEWNYSLGHHGHQNPPTPLNNRVYFHRSNAVICMSPTGT
jgi:outer membrane protein assembly factor BamB